MEYEEVVHSERIPVERTITDYYAVETQVEYIPKEIEETIIEYEPVEKTWERVQYLPVETQIVHYPEREKYVAGQGGQYIQGGYTTKTETIQQPVSTTYQTSSYVPAQTSYVTGTTSNYVSGGNYATGSSGVGQTYVTGGSGVGQTTTYVNQPVSNGYTTSNYVGGGSGVGQTTYVSQPATTTYVSQPATTTYTTTEYVQPTTYTTTNYNQGTTYVSGGSGVRNATYETTNVTKYWSGIMFYFLRMVI